MCDSTREPCRPSSTYTEGYPYFVQEYGRSLWDSAEGSPVGAVETIEAQALVEARSMRSSSGTRLERASPTELRSLLRHGDARDEPQRAMRCRRGDGAMFEQVATLRARLIDKGLLFAARNRG